MKCYIERSFLYETFNCDTHIMETTTKITLNTTEGVSNISTSRSNMEIPIEAAITIYSIIFVLAVVGNILVILTLVQNKRMRTVTNVFLLNLAISDLLLAVFCMPFTLVPIMIKNFIFGPFICVSIRYAQAVSVGANCFTLVAISLERYFAICRPLHSRQWQTLSHSYKIILICWLVALIIAIPIAVNTRHVEIVPGLSFCRERWESVALERAYTTFLDAVLLFIPLIIMTGAYAKIMRTLCTDITVEDSVDDGSIQNGTARNPSMVELVSLKSGIIRCSLHKNAKTSEINRHPSMSAHKRDLISDSPGSSVDSTPRRKLEKSRIIRQTNYERNRKAKLRVVRMLFVVVMEFFVCWTPLYALQTWKSFHEESIKRSISDFTWSTMFLLSYISSCCNPITYCFMNRRFRQSFIAALRCCLCCSRDRSFSKFMSSKARSSTRQMTWVDANDEDTDYKSIQRNI